MGLGIWEFGIGGLEQGIETIESPDLRPDLSWINFLMIQ